MEHKSSGRMILRGMTIVTVDDADSILTGDLAISDGMIQAVAPFIETEPDDEILCMHGLIAMPAFIQTHVHLCQTLWRNLADDMSLMDWLFTRTWPFEAAMDEKSIAASVRLGAAELLSSGTLTVNDFGLVTNATEIPAAASGTGLRGVFARILMDDHEGPARLRDDPEKAVTEALEIAGALTGMPDVAGFSLAPRFAVSCSARLLGLVSEASASTGIPIHTHASENDQENDLTISRFGMRPIRLYESMGVLGPGLRLAHCVKIHEDEIMMLAQSSTRVLHCPTTNLKLASGIAPVPAMLDAGIPVSIGADGAPANNNLNMFKEMRLASLIQKPLHGPDAMPARQVIRMATMNGAVTLGLQDITGSIEPGKRADILLLDPGRPNSTPFDDPCPAIVYSMDRDNVVHLLSAGRFVVRDGRCVLLEPDSVCTMAALESERLVHAARSGLKGH